MASSTVTLCPVVGRGVTYTGLRALIADEVRGRVRAGWSVASIGRRCAISQPMLHNWLAGRRQLSPEFVDQVLACLGIDLCLLMASASGPPPAAPPIAAPRRSSAWHQVRRPEECAA